MLETMHTERGGSPTWYWTAAYEASQLTTRVKPTMRYFMLRLHFFEPLHHISPQRNIIFHGFHSLVASIQRLGQFFQAAEFIRRWQPKFHLGFGMVNFYQMLFHSLLLLTFHCLRTYLQRHLKIETNPHISLVISLFVTLAYDSIRSIPLSLTG